VRRCVRETCFANPNQINRVTRKSSRVYVLLTLLLGAYQGLNHVIGLRSTHFAPWKPFIWELSSVIVLAALIPFIAGFERRLSPIDIGSC